MSKAEMVRQSAAAENERRIERLASATEALRQANIRNAEELAELIEPLAQAMATLTDEMRSEVRKTHADLRKSADAAMVAAKLHRQEIEQIQRLTEDLSKGLENLIQRTQGWQHWLMVAMTGASAGLAVGAFLVYLAP